MIKLIDLLNEAPIGTYKTIGDFEKGASYKDTRDRAAVSHPATVQKVTDMLKNTIVDFDFYGHSLRYDSVPLQLTTFE